MSKTLHRLSIFLTIFCLSSVITACRGNTDLESLISPDPQLQTPTPTPTTTAVEIPLAFPEIIPVYPQAEVSAVAPDLTDKQGKVTWKSTDPINLIQNYYLEQLKAQNWSLTEDANNPILASQDNLKVIISLQPQGSQTEIVVEYDRQNPQAISVTPPPQLENISPNFSKYIQDLNTLGVFEAYDFEDNQQFNPNQVVTRREYARWLLTANNLFYRDTPPNQIRLASPTSQPAFADIPPNDADFPIIQGLAEAGLIRSQLNDENASTNFRPEDNLTRQDLIAWKVPLDFRKPLPPTAIADVKATWGFQDLAKIEPYLLPRLYIDYQNSQPNITRAFGYSTLFLPDKAVTRAEAAAVLWRFGFQDQSLSANEAIATSD